MPVVLYSLLRVALLALAMLALWAVGLRGWLLVVVAVVVALAVSYLTLGRQRDAAAVWLADRTRRRSEESRFARSVQDDAAVEDAEADAAGATGAGPATEEPRAPGERPGT